MSRRDAPAWIGDKSSWVNLADCLISAGLDRASSEQVHAEAADKPSNHGVAADRMEGFARVFLLAAFRIAGTKGQDCERLISQLSSSIKAGVNGAEINERWPQPVDFGHSIVEGSSIALGLWLTRPWIWDKLDEADRLKLSQWLATAASAETSKNNWVMFGAVISAFLIATGKERSDSQDILNRSLSTIEEWVAHDGWFSDGPTKSYDYYNSWAFHFYPPLIAYLGRDADLLDTCRTRLNAFLKDYPRLFSYDGGHVYFGRSLTYRFAASAAVSVGALIGCTSLAPSRAREIATANVDYFLKGDLPPREVLLFRGWLDKNIDIVQAYSGPLASYWGAKAFVNLLIPADSDYWTKRSQPSMIADAGQDSVTRIEAPNLLVGRSENGSVVRIANHGSYNRITTDDQGVVDDKLYSRLGYSNMTAPVNSSDARDSGFYFSSVLGPSGRGQLMPIGGGHNWASSQSHHRLRNPLALPSRLGRRMGKISKHFMPSITVKAGPIKTLTLMRGTWNVEILHAPTFSALFRAANFSGWAIAETSRTAVQVLPDGIRIDNGTLVSTTISLLGFSRFNYTQMEDPSPFGGTSTLTNLSAPLPNHTQPLLLAAATCLSLQDSSYPVEAPPTVSDGGRNHLSVTWDDGFMQRVAYETMTVGRP